MLLSMLSRKKGILAPECGAGYGNIDLPLSARRIALRKAFCTGTWLAGKQVFRWQ
jgi:hypothetical protein